MKTIWIAVDEMKGELLWSETGFKPLSMTGPTEELIKWDDPLLIHELYRVHVHVEPGGLWCIHKIELAEWEEQGADPMDGYLPSFEECESILLPLLEQKTLSQRFYENSRINPTEFLGDPK